MKLNFTRFVSISNEKNLVTHNHGNTPLTEDRA